MRAHYLSKLLGELPEKIFAPNIFLAILAAKDSQKLMNVRVTHQVRKTGVVSIIKWNLVKSLLSIFLGTSSF